MAHVAKLRRSCPAEVAIITIERGRYLSAEAIERREALASAPGGP